MFLQKTTVLIFIPHGHEISHTGFCVIYFWKKGLTAEQTHQAMYSDMHKKSVLTAVNVAA